MKKVFILTLALFLTGCGESTTQTINSPQGEFQKGIGITQLHEVKQQAVETVGLGETCGGEAAISCKSGHICQLTEKHIQSKGICIETVTQKNLTCPKEKAPVCAEREGITNGYLNECEAIRHGATVVSQGLCPNK